MRTQAPRAPEAITFERDYRGTIDQARYVRTDLAKVAADCPVADDMVLLASELATNAILHSKSGHPDRTFWSIPGFVHTWFCVSQLRQVALL